MKLRSAVCCSPPAVQPVPNRPQTADMWPQGWGPLLYSVLFRSFFLQPDSNFLPLSCFLSHLFVLCINLFSNIYLVFCIKLVLVIFFFNYFLLHMKCQLNFCHVLAGEPWQLVSMIPWAAHDGNCWVLMGWISSRFSQS